MLWDKKIVKRPCCTSGTLGNCSNSPCVKIHQTPEGQQGVADLSGQRQMKLESCQRWNQLLGASGSLGITPQKVSPSGGQQAKLIMGPWARRVPPPQSTCNMSKLGTLVVVLGAPARLALERRGSLKPSVDRLTPATSPQHGSPTHPLTCLCGLLSTAIEPKAAASPQASGAGREGWSHQDGVNPLELPTRSRGP